MGNWYDDTFEKNKGFATDHGVRFQVDLSIVFLLNALKTLDNCTWRLSTENAKAGKFDDVVIEFCDKSTVLLQAKQKKNKGVIAFNDLINSKSDDFSLAKYFLSYQDIKDKFKVKHVIVCTNAEVHENILTFLNQSKTSYESMLHCGDGHYQCYTFKKDILAHLRKAIQDHYKQKQKNNIDETALTDQNLVGFLNHFRLYAKYPSGKKLERIIEELLNTVKYSYTLIGEATYQDIFHQMREWSDRSRGKYLREIDARAIFCKIRSNKYCDVLTSYDVYFENNKFIFADNYRRIFYITTEGGFLLQSIKLCRTFQNNNTKILYINPDESIELQKELIEAFQLPQFTYLIIIFSIITHECVLREIWNKLREILEKNEEKKIILVVDRRNNLVTTFLNRNEYIVIDGVVKFRELTKDTQEKLLKKKNIVFQGKFVDLKELFGLEDYRECIHTEILEKLIKNKKVRVGSEIRLLDEDVEQYYINRKFYRGNEERDEENIYDVNEKMILISDSAGMGKTTVLTKLADVIKKKNPHLWVIKIELGDYTSILKDCLKRKDKKITIETLLDSLHATKLTNHLENLVFSMKNKVVLMFDAIDEVSPDYSDLILNLLVQCQKAPNFVKILATTRPQMTYDLEKHLQMKLLLLRPFIETNQIDFLTKYWMKNLNLCDTKKKKCMQFARTLINKMSSWLGRYYHEKYHFAAMPLQIRMLAEIFQENNLQHEDWEGCKQFLDGNAMEPKLPTEMNYTKLYEMFIAKKREVFVNKGNPNGNLTAIPALVQTFDDCLCYHRNLALELILNKSKCKLLSCYQRINTKRETVLLKMGIVQKINAKFIFVHRTFAEYFVAESLLTELKSPKKNIKFEKFLIDEVFSSREFEVIRYFFDGFLQKNTESISFDIFEKYQYTTMSYWNGQIIYSLAYQGFTRILHVLLKSIIKVIECKDGRMQTINYFITAIKCRYGNLNEMVLAALQMAAVVDDTESIEILLAYGDVNTTNFEGSALHLAVVFGKIETIEFLLIHGGNINVQDSRGKTPLHLAILNGRTDIVKLLLVYGGDVNVRDDNGRTPLHLTAEDGDIEGTMLLLTHGGNTMIRDEHGMTPLHLVILNSALNNKSITLQLLLGRGSDVNTKDDEGCTPLHLATKNGDTDIAELLLVNGGDANITDECGRTSLHLAVFNSVLNSKTDMVQLLLEHKGYGNIRDDDGVTPLQLAYKFLQTDVVKLLLAYGGDVNVTDLHGKTLVYLAVEMNRTEMVQLFLEHQGNVNFGDHNSNTPLHIAVGKGDIQLVELLLSHGANACKRNNNRGTPIHLAVNAGKTDIAKLLLRHMNVSVTDKDGCVAIHIIDGNGITDVLELHINHKKKTPTFFGNNFKISFPYRYNSVGNI